LAKRVSEMFGVFLLVTKWWWIIQSQFHLIYNVHLRITFYPENSFLGLSNVQMRNLQNLYVWLLGILDVVVWWSRMQSLMDIVHYTFVGPEDDILFDLDTLRTVLWDYQMYRWGTFKIHVWLLGVLDIADPWLLLQSLIVYISRAHLRVFLIGKLKLRKPKPFYLLVLLANLNNVDWTCTQVKLKSRWWVSYHLTHGTFLFNEIKMDWWYR